MQSLLEDDLTNDFLAGRKQSPSVGNPELFHDFPDPRTTIKIKWDYRARQHVYMPLPGEQGGIIDQKQHVKIVRVRLCQRAAAHQAEQDVESMPFASGRKDGL